MDKEAQKNNTAVFILSCDSYSDTWEPFHILFDKYWDCPYEVYIVTENKDCNFFKTVKTTGSWTRRVREALEQVDTDYVIILLDDFFIRSQVDQKRINYCVDHFETDIAVFNFEKEYSQNIDVGLEGFKLRANRQMYLCSCQPSIWNRNILIELLDNDMTPWNWEMQILDSKYRFYINSGDLIFNIGEKGVIKRGKWVEKEIRFLRDENIEIDYSGRGFYG